MNTDKYILQEVTTSAQEREWLDLPKKIYKGNRNWVCPLDQDITEVFDPARNELFADGEAVRWVVRNKAGEVVGRIAAFYNREKAAIEEQPTGGCGFFEAIDDQQVADMMFDASRMWLASRGMEAMDGPINFGQRRDWWGLLVEGYEFQPLYKNPYNLIIRSCSRITASKTISTSTALSGVPMSRRPANGFSTAPKGSSLRRGIMSRIST